MSETNVEIREIQPQDNVAVEQVIRNCFYEYNLPLVGTAYEDLETKMMFQSYKSNNELYLVLESQGKVIGGGGIKPLKDFEADVCELQKLYFSPKARGKGLGRELTEKLLVKAKQMGYKTCYLESGDMLKEALHLYEKLGFQHLNGPLGNTGHHACGIFMTKQL